MAHAQRYETKQDFDEAFEELYQRSPMPQQVKPLLAAYWSPVPQVTQGHGTGVKAIFDMMKRNTSISSDLNTSCTSVDTTFTSDRTDNQQNNGEVPKDKENLTPEKDSGRGVVATEERQLPPVPPFPTAHCSAIVSRHGALVNGPELPKSPLPQAMRSSEQSGWAVIELSDKTTEILSFSTSNQGVFNHDSTLSSPEEKSADQETLKLVSKLVQRLQSSAESDLDSFDDTEQSPSRQTRNTAFTGHGSIQQQQQISKTVGTKANGGSEGVDITSKKQRKTRATNEADNFGQQNGVSAAESAAQQVSSNGASKPSRSLRRQKLQRHTGKPSDTTIEREDTVDTGHNQNSRRKETWSVTRFQTDTVTQNTTEHVEVDTIAQESAGPLPSDTDIFSLNLSSEDHAEEVENDAILFASQKSRLAAMASSSMSSHQQDFRTRHVSSHPGPLPRKRKLMEESASLAEEHSKKYKGKAWPLRSWSLQPVPRLKGVRVEGKLPNTDYYWCSSVIMHRVGGRTLKSNNGSLYSLIGNMSIANTMHAGFSKDLAKKFHHGFPEDWKDLIQAELELNSMKTNLSAVVEENMLESPTEGNQEQVKSKDHSKASSKAVTCRNLTVVIDDIIPARVSQEQERPKTSKRRTELRDAHIPVPKTRDNQGSFHTPEPQKKNEKSSPIWTPQGVVSRALGADQVRRTQSGRCVIPPLARWAGQYVEKDADGNVIIGFQSQAAEKHFAKMAEQEMSILARRRGMKSSVSLFSSYVNSPSSIVGRKAASTATTKSHRAQQNKTSAVEPQIECGDKNNCADNTSAQKAGENDGACESGNCLSESTDVSVDNMEQEVMAIVRKSRETRQQKAVKKRNTCYSQAASENTSKGRRTKNSVEKPGLSFTESRLETSHELSEASGTKSRNTHFGQTCRTSVAADSRSKPSLEVSEASGAKRRNVHVGQAGQTPAETDSRSEPSLELSEASGAKSRNTDVGQAGQTSAESDSRSELSVELSKASGAKSRNTRGRTTRGRGSERGRARPWKVLVIEDSTEDEDPQADGPKDSDNSLAGYEDAKNGQRSQVRSRGRGRKKRAGKSVTGRGRRNAETSSLQEDADTPWSSKELQRLQEAKEQVPSDNAQFWEVVSRHVGTRSKEECASQCLRDFPQPKGKSKSQRKTSANDREERSEAPTLQARRGTLKRRQELRAVLDHENDNAEDDWFDATPFKTRARAKIPCVDFSKTEEEVFGRNPNFFTPQVDGSHRMGGHFSKTPVSSRKTPSIRGAFSPCLEGSNTRRKAVDQYVFRLQKNRHQLTKACSKKTSKTQPLQPDSPPAMRLFGQTDSSGSLFKIAEVNSSEGEDDGEEKDYYYSDAEN